MNRPAPRRSALKGKRRAYQHARAVAHGGGFAVALDAEILKTPAGAELVTPQRALAEAIAAEWDAQGPEIDPAAMPLTRLANTAIDRIAPARAASVAALAGFAENDLVCFRADGPAELVRAQEDGFGPLLAWVRERYGADFQTGTGIMPLQQPKPAIEHLARALADCDAMMLAGLAAAAARCGSLILALALAEREIEAERALALAETDEDYQARRWGVDPAYEARREAIRRDIASAARFMELCRG